MELRPVRFPFVKIALFIVLAIIATKYLFPLGGFLFEAIPPFFFFLGPMGIGLLWIPHFFSDARTTQPRRIGLIHFFLCVFFAWPLTAGFFLWLELNDYLGKYAVVWSFVWISLALYGWSQIDFFKYKPRWPNLLSFTVVALVSVPILIYWLAGFSDYPYRDLFQDVHFLKASHEFSRFGILNAMVANSYLPIIQSHYGFLQSVLNIKGLPLFWHTFLPSLIFQSVCALIFFRSIFSEPIKIIAGTVMYVALHKHIFFINNNDLLSAYCLVIFAYVRTEPRLRQTNRPLLQLAIALTLVGINSIYRYESYPMVWIFYMLAGLLVLISLTQTYHRFWPPMVFLFLGWTAVGMHHSALLLFPLTLFFAWAFDLSHLSKSYLWSQRVLAGVLGLALTMILFNGIPYTLNKFFGYSEFAWLKVFQTLQLQVFSLLTGKDLSAVTSVSIVGNFGNTAIEAIRSFPPTAIALLLFIFCRFLVLRKKTELTESAKTNLTSAYWTAALSVGLIAIVFFGMPLIYRTFFWVTALLSYSAIKLLDYQPPMGDRERKYCGILAALGLFFYSWSFYRVPSLGQSEKPFLFWLTPWGHIVLAAILIAITLWIFLQSRYRSWLAILVIGLVLGFDQMLLRTLLFTYSYGPNRYGPVITHYDRLDIDLGRWLSGKFDKQILMLSDPITLNHARAFSGNSGIFYAPNIATLNLDEEEQLRGIFKELLLEKSMTGEEFSEAMANHINRFRGGGEAFFSVSRNNGDFFGCVNMVGVYLLVTQRTIDWTKNEFDYFPSAKLMNPEDVSHLSTIGFKPIGDVHKSAFIFKIPPMLGSKFALSNQCLIR